MTEAEGVVVGAIVGALAAIGGAFLTDRGHDRRSKVDREFSLRREIYLDGAEAISSALNSIALLPNLSISEGQLTSAYLAKLPVIARAYVVSGDDTALSFGTFAATLAAVLRKLLKQRHELIQAWGVHPVTHEDLLGNDGTPTPKEVKDRLEEFKQVCNEEHARLVDALIPLIQSVRRELNLVAIGQDELRASLGDAFR